LLPTTIINSNLPTEILTKIEEFKTSAIEHALNFMANDAKYAETKELKDMVSIVDTIEKSYTGRDDSKTTINIAMQNMVKKYSDDI